MQQNRSQAGEIVRVRHCAGEGLAFVKSWPTDPSPAEKRNCSGGSAPVSERWAGSGGRTSACRWPRGA